MKKNKIFYHKKQLQFTNARQRTRVLIAGRAFGKGVCIGRSFYLKMMHLPRSKHFLSSSTYGQMLTKTLPVIFNKWAEYGLKRHYDMKNPGHYVVGKRPPDAWQTPWQKPDLYKNVITFWNGFTIELLSMDRADLARGGNYDGGEIDEALLVKKEHYSKVLLPATRGTSPRLFQLPYHKQISFYTSVPWLASAQWLFEYEERSKSTPDDVFYMEGLSTDNPLITEEDIRIWKQEMDYLDFQVEVMNMRITRSEKAFYHSWDDDKHLYTPKWNYQDDEDVGISVNGQASARKKNMPLDMSFDFSGWFNCCTVYQKHVKTERMIDKFFVKQDNVSTLIENICIDCADQKRKHVNIYGEPRGHDRRAEGDSLYTVISKIFNRNGWSVSILAKKKAAQHEVRHELVNTILQETNPKLPQLRVNQSKCKDVVIAMKMAEILPNHKKSKKDERDRKFPQEHATHFTDTVDYFFEQKYGGVSTGFSQLPGFADF